LMVGTSCAAPWNERGARGWIATHRSPVRMEPSWSFAAATATPTMPSGLLTAKSSRWSRVRCAGCPRIGRCP